MHPMIFLKKDMSPWKDYNTSIARFYFHVERGKIRKQCGFIVDFYNIFSFGLEFILIIITSYLTRASSRVGWYFF